MRAVVAALAANLGIAIAKFVAFLVTGSASMLAESVHSVADTGNEFLLLVGSGRSRRARTELHPFGFGKERYFYAFVVLGVAAVLEAFSLRTAIRESNHERGGRPWHAFIRATKSPELPVVLLEDLAALLGLGFAFAGVLLSDLTGSGVWDGVGSVAVGVLLACAAFIVGVEMKSLLIGESASAD